MPDETKVTEEDRERLHIAIDYDDTFTAAPLLWKQFIAIAEATDHRCYIVTCRGREDIDEIAAVTGMRKGRIYCTGGSAKRWFMNGTDVEIDIWCDDDPASVVNGK